MVTKEQLLEQLNTFSLAVGKPVMVHTSLRSVGAVEGGGDTVLDALIEFFTQRNGLLCVPTHTWDTDYLDLREAESCLGTLPRLAATRKDGFRSHHPSHSMMVFGEGGEEFAALDDAVDSPANPAGCIGKLFDLDGYVLLVGIGHNKNTFLHCAEEMLCVPGRLTKETVERYIIHEDGSLEIRDLHWFDEDYIEDVSVFFGKYEPAFRYHGCILDGKLGDAPVQLCSAWKMYEVMALVRRRTHGMELLSDHTPLPPESYEIEKGDTE